VSADPSRLQCRLVVSNRFWSLPALQLLDRTCRALGSRPRIQLESGRRPRPGQRQVGTFGPGHARS
jgi:hypothetical protein